jgi:hypothetical protein
MVAPGNWELGPTEISSPGFDVDGRLSAVIADLALALGLVRVLTLLPLYDSSLDELEQRLASCLEEVRLARAVLRDVSIRSCATPEAGL